MTGMIVSAAGPLDPAPGGVRALYVALNHPVVTVDGLPLGPAAAAIALHDGGGATLMIRSSRSHGVAFLQASAPSDPRLGAAAAFDHAEGLGFLFDEEMPLEGGDRRVGWPAWLVELFPVEEDPAGLLSKFRASLPMGHAAPIHPEL